METRAFKPTSYSGSFLIAVLSCVMATGLRFLLDPYLGSRSPYATFFLAVALAAWVSGWRGGVFAIIIGTLAADYFFIEPRGSLSLDTFDQQVQNGIFVTVSLIIVIISEVRLIQNNRIRKLLKEAHDEIEQRRAAERALAESEAKFRAVAETASTAIYIHDGQKLVYVNPAAEHITGLSRKELYQSDMWGLVHPADREVLKERAAARFRGEASPNRYEYRLVHKDGRDVWIDFGATVIDYDGKRCILANAFDVTQRKLAEDALIRSEKLASAGRLAATIAHEINNPLEAVTNLLYLSRTDPANTAKYITMAEGELKRVAHIARQTLGFYRDVGSPERVELASLVREVLALYAKRIETKDLIVHSELQSDIFLMASSGELRQIVSNLVSNAIDAMPPYGKLTLQLRRARHFQSSIEGARLVVADSGSGIPSAVRNRIFEAFFTTKQDVGTGLGLWVTRSLVEKNGGSIHVKTSVNPEAHGTVFSVFFPLAKPASRTEAA